MVVSTTRMSRSLMSRTTGLPEADVGVPGPFLRFGGDEPGVEETASDRRDRHGDPVVFVEVPGDGVGPGVETRCGQFGP